MSDIRARIEKLIGPSATVNGTVESNDAKRVDELWRFWRLGLIDRLEKNAKVLYGRIEGNYGFFDKPQRHCDGNDANTLCIALDFQPIKRGVTKDEITKMLRTPKDAAQHGYSWSIESAVKLADRIEKEGICD